MQSHDYFDDGSKADQPYDSPVELHNMNSRNPPSQQRQPATSLQHVQQLHLHNQQYGSLPQDDNLASPYPFQDGNDHRFMTGPPTEFSRPLVSPRQTPVYQSAHTSSTAVNTDNENFSSTTPPWTLNLQNGSTGFLTESHNNFGFQSNVSSPRNSGRASTIDLAYLKRHKPLASMTDSRPGTPSRDQSQVTLTKLLQQTPEPALSNDWVVPGSVAQLHDRDDADTWKGWRRFVYRFTPYLTILNMGLYLLYLAFRIYCIVAAQNKFGITFAAAWLFVAVEVATAIPSLLHNCWTVMAIHKRRRPKLRWMGDDAPTVDVFITCCKEDNDVIMDTVRGACDLDYPRNRFRVILLDDGNVESLAKEVEALSATYPNLIYISRPKYPGVPHHFKAGNLNYGLDASLSFPGGAGEYMAALDADMHRLDAGLGAYDAR
ncbi:MAG: hypothetical protein STHCBS139747_006678 [Sporothrix thermara]